MLNNNMLYLFPYIDTVMYTDSYIRRKQIGYYHDVVVDLRGGKSCSYIYMGCWNKAKLTVQVFLPQIIYNFISKHLRNLEILIYYHSLTAHSWKYL